MKRIKLLLTILLCCMCITAPAQAKIKLSKTSKVMNLGTTYTLKLKGTNKNSKWVNINKNILKMKKVSKYKYKIKALKIGTARVKVRVKGKKYYCIFTVENPYYIKKSFVLIPGQKTNLQVLGTNHSKTFSSSKSSVAKVSSTGTVTAKSAGTATIYCKVNNSSIKANITVCDINDKSLSLEMGEKFTLKIQNYSGSVQWSTADSEIAQVSSSGKVTAMKKGTTTITGKCSLGTFTSKIKVKDYELSHSSMVLAKGDTHQLTYTDSRITPTYESADPEIATVDSLGNVSGVALGETVITSDIKGIKHTCTVVVKDQGLSFDKKTITFAGFQLYVINWDGDVSWKSSNTSVATVDEKGYVTGYKRGTATITATISREAKEATDTEEAVEAMEASFDCEIKVIPGGEDFFAAWKTVTAEMLKNKFVYGTGGYNYASATANKKASCAETVCFVLQRLGDLPNGYGFYCASDGSMKGNAASMIKSSKNFTVLYPNKKEQYCDLEPGDIVGLSGSGWGHTQVYAGRNSSGQMLFYSGGTDAAVNGKGSLFSSSKLPVARRISSYEDDYVRFIVRRK